MPQCGGGGGEERRGASLKVKLHTSHLDFVYNQKCWHLSDASLTFKTQNKTKRTHRNKTSSVPSSQNCFLHLASLCQRRTKSNLTSSPQGRAFMTGSFAHVPLCRTRWQSFLLLEVSLTWDYEATIACHAYLQNPPSLI